jgi:hypothetical protein
VGADERYVSGLMLRWGQDYSIEWMVTEEEIIFGNYLVHPSAHHTRTAPDWDTASDDLEKLDILPLSLLTWY